MADLISRNLSSATKAVVVAFTNDPDWMKICEEERVSLAAALRAAADQMSSHHSKAYLYSLADGLKLKAIAAELETQ